MPTKTILLALAIFMPSLYSHRDGRRVRQFQPLPKVAAFPVPKVEGYSNQWIWERGPWSGSVYYYRERFNKSKER